MRKSILAGAIAFLLILSTVSVFASGAPAPTVNITSPVNGATVSGTQVLISADAYSGGSKYTITKITYKIDNGSEIQMSGPNGSASGTWTAYWDSTKVSNGSHTITVTAYNSAKKKTAKTITVNVSNVSNPHANLNWSDYPSNCYSCHANKFLEVYQSLHYQWQAVAPDNTNKTGTLQGKISNAMNAYCINILGNWTLCGRCHAGRGAQPVYTQNPNLSQLLNIDCLVCHNEAYALSRVRKSDGTMGPPDGTSVDVLNSYVRNVGKPTRGNCLKCHAYAGGGDAVKRGDLAWAHYNNSDPAYDVHMATTRGNFTCQRCHKFVNHRVTGKGSDLESTDYQSEVKCATSECHPDKVNGGHATAKVNDHIARVACQTCHIPIYGKVATEIERDWRETHATQPPFHPSSVKASNLTPVYKWWNRKTWNYLLNDVAVYNPSTGAYMMDILQGNVSGDTSNKIYAFKYKISWQPIITRNNVLIAIDTNEYINVSGNYNLAVQKGLAYMGYSTNEAWTTVKVETYQMLNHGVADAQLSGAVLKCVDCHENTSRMDLKGSLGYSLKNSQSVVCSQCHNVRSWKGYIDGHDTHVTRKKYDCSWCHNFSRPERNLIKP